MTIAFNPTPIDFSSLANLGQNIGGALGQHNLGTAMQSAIGPNGEYDYNKMISVLAGRNPMLAAKLATDAKEAEALAAYRKDSLVPPEVRLYDHVYPGRRGADAGPPAPGTVQVAQGDAPQGGPSLADFLTDKKGGKPGEIARDKEFGKEVADWRAGGGFAAVSRQLGQLGAGVDALDAAAAKGGGSRISGPIVGSLSDGINSFINPEAINTREVIEESIQSSLRKVLGAQYTQLEGEALLRRTFNPRLDEKTNATRARRVMHQLKTMAAVKDDAANYFEEHGTLRGWNGTIPNMDAIDADAPTPDEEGAKNQSRLEASPAGDPTPMTGRSFVEPVMGEAGPGKDKYGAPIPKPEHVVRLRQKLSQHPDPQDQALIMEEWERKFPQYGRGAADRALGRDVQAGR
jgi:hypothetical protein